MDSSQRGMHHEGMRHLLPGSTPARRALGGAPRAGLLLILLATGWTAACQGPGREAIEAKGALGPYSRAMISGDLVFVSGQIGDTTGSFEQEAHSAIDKVEAALAEAGLGLADVLASTVYLVDMDLYQPLNAIYAARFPAPYPTRACIAVKELPANARVEIVVTARR